MGKPLTHPWFDWLARDFVNLGCDLRRLPKSMVLSHTTGRKAGSSRKPRKKIPKTFSSAGRPPTVCLRK